MTRPLEYKDSFHAAFSKLDLAIVDCPLSRTEPIEDVEISLAGTDILVFTSQIAVGLFAKLTSERNIPAYAVGSATANALSNCGFSHVICTGFSGGQMIKALNKVGFHSGLYLSAEIVACGIDEAFVGRVRRLKLYRMQPAQAFTTPLLSVFNKEQGGVIPFFSRRSYEVFETLLTQYDLREKCNKFDAIGMSANVFTNDSTKWRNRLLADKPTFEGMLSAFNRTFRIAPRPGEAA